MFYFPFMLVEFGLLLAIVGFVIHLIIVHMNSKDGTKSRSMLIGMIGVTAVIYPLIMILILSELENGGDATAMGVFFFGMGMFFINLSRSLFTPDLLKILNKSPKNIGRSIILLFYEESIAILILMISLIGYLLLQEGMPPEIFNTAVMYMVIGSSLSALLIGIVLRMSLSQVENLKESFQKILIRGVFPQIFTILGIILAIQAYAPYLQ